MYFPDQLDRSIQLTKFPPKRIVSLVPSQTELLYYLGLDQEVVGITKFCVHPEQWFRSKTRIGGTKHLHLDRIQALAPDLIIANKEENPKEQIKELMKDYPVWISDIQTLEDAFEMIRQVGRLTDRIPKAQHLVKELQQQFASLPPCRQHLKLLISYGEILIWLLPTTPLSTK
jgi:ABC-type Fe3+-hydroxamate transport system substrate-binding protein